MRVGADDSITSTNDPPPTRPTANAGPSTQNCTSALFFEGRKRGTDLYLWAAKTPGGPTAKFLVQVRGVKD